MNTKNKTAAWDIAIVGIMIAVIEVCKITLSFLPNIELTSFLLIMFTLHFGRKVLFAVPAFIAIEVLIFGFDIFWVTAYVYIWPLLCILTYFFRKNPTTVGMSVLSGVFGLFFGFLCSFPYIFLANGSTRAGIGFAISWWIAGIPFDIVHGIANFIIMFFLFTPVSKTLTFLTRKVSKRTLTFL